MDQLIERRLVGVAPRALEGELRAGHDVGELELAGGDRLHALPPVDPGQRVVFLHKPLEGGEQLLRPGRLVGRTPRGHVEVAAEEPTAGRASSRR